MNDTRSQGSTSTDTWDQPSASAATRSQRKPVQQVIPDDWDNDEDEEEDSAKVWEDANNKAPMPELIISPSSTGMSFAPPPPAAYQPTVRILKRPSPSQSASNSTASLASQTRNTLAEREAQYQEARDRIFGATNEGCGDDLDGGRRVRSPKDTGGKGADAGFAVLRTPLGPSDAEQDASTSRTDGTPPKGFRERKNGRNQSISSSSISQRT
ncbi:hypothetical protein M405DRAFT_853054 [Rhizopogon salebrosus TDB-379]|nr:hypothetical protein M405DRAFT_853054 [Rhizopogon salebrosus TDB-379]